MHRIIKAHLDSFVRNFGLDGIAESAQFEQFSNYAVIASRTASSYELDDVTTGEGDDGTDGIAVIIDEDIVISEEDAQSIFLEAKRNHDVEVLFIQTKRSDSFDLGEFLKFKESILKFVNADDYTVNDDVQLSARKVFDVAMDNVPKIRLGKPNLTARYVATGVYRQPEPLETAKREFQNQLRELGLFASIDIQFIGRDELTSLWVATYSGVSAQLDMFSNAPMPTIAGINEAYLAVVRAREFVNKLLLTDDGNLRAQVFEENVRAFLGSDNPVNQSIATTLNSGVAASRFPVLNNGITIVSPGVIVQGTILHLENYQIVNGCQTSNILFENRAALDDSIMVTLKVVETTNEDVFSELVRATNSQTKVDETQFLSLRPIVKKIEQYFNTYEGMDGRLYFERRDRQYIGKDIPAIRIFNLHVATKCVAAMFFQRPDLSFKYPKRMYDELAQRMFTDDNKEIVFYSACLVLYRLHLLVANSTLPQNMRRFKWHILVLVRAIVAGRDIPRLNSRQIEPYCQKLVDAFCQHGEVAIDSLRQAVGIIQSMGDVTNDRLKRQAIMDEMLAKIG
jgi:hypothetical protein